MFLGVELKEVFYSFATDDDVVFLFIFTNGGLLLPWGVVLFLYRCGCGFGFDLLLPCSSLEGR